MMIIGYQIFLELTACPGDSPSWAVTHIVTLVTLINYRILSIRAIFYNTPVYSSMGIDAMVTWV